MVLAGCTSGTGEQDIGSPPAGSSGAPSGAPSGSAGPVRETPAHSCRFADPAFVRNAMGMRLGRITRLAGGGVTGCRFYALQDSSLHTSEHLPGPHQPVLEIVVRRFASPVEANNAVVFVARAGAHAQRVDLGRITGDCFQTAFDPKDNSKDWACAANAGRTEVLVHSVDTTGTFSTATVIRAVLRRV
ncbi:MAG: hypothetical protein QOH89_1336 [Pseudonocardiales bacterium]|nr:hypothetical protein [Pseudonocardiales bacterium]MDT4940393.1 hypothetical protein [Pseudonocardiales bacterium]